MASPSFGNPTPSPTPNSTSVVLTVGESTAFQSIPEIGGYAAEIAFPKVAPETKAPSAKATDKPGATPAPAPTPVSISVGATLSVVKPNDGPDLNLEGGKGKHRKTRGHPARALAYLTLLPTHDVTLDSYPRIAIDVPRDIVTQYRDGEFGLALWNSGEKDAIYRLAVAELDKATTPPPMAARITAPAAVAVASGMPSATPAGTSTPASGGRFGNGLPGLGANTPVTAPNGSGAPVPSVSGAVAPSVAPTLAPQRIFFAGTEKTFKLIANRPAVFAIYALPNPAAGTPAPSSSPNAKSATSASAAPGASSTPSAAGSSAAPSSASTAPTAILSTPSANATKAP